MNSKKIDREDIEYIADMLRAILWAKKEAIHVSPDSLADLEVALSAAELSLRRTAKEMAARPSS